MVSPFSFCVAQRISVATAAYLSVPTGKLRNNRFVLAEELNDIVAAEDQVMI
jgi:hypothetical protein